MHCDFCYAINAPHQFAAANITIDFGVGPLHQSVGAWQACDVCADLVARGDRDGLVQRAFQSLRRLHPDLGDIETLARLRDVLSAALDAIYDT